MQKHLIVNADDFNTDPERNRGIQRAAECGMVTSATLLANRPIDQEELRALRDTLGDAVGVHLNLSSGFPLTPGLKTLVGTDGRFFSKAVLWRKALCRRLDLREVATEFAAQIGRVRDAGLLPDHVDGNNHIHVFPGFAMVVARLMRQFDINKVRLPREPFFSGGRPAGRGMFKKMLLSFLSAGALPVFEHFELKFTDHFAGVQNPEMTDEGSLIKFLRRLPPGVTELMCHPGFVSGSGNPFSNKSRQRELEILTDLSVLEAVRASGIELIAYKDLK